MDKSIKRFLWSLLGIVLLFFGIQNMEAVGAGLTVLMDLIAPLLYGCAIAYILNLLVRWLEKYLTFGVFRHQIFRRIVTIILSILIVVAMVAALVAGLVPEIKASIGLLTTQLPDAIQDLVDLCIHQLGMPAEWFSGFRAADIVKFLESLFQNGVIQKLLSSGTGFVSGALTGMLDFFLGLFFAIYILIQKEKLGSDLRRLCKAYLKPAVNERVLYVVSTMDSIYSSYITGQCLDACILGVMVSVTLMLFGIDYALLIGILVAVTALVPIVGAFLGGVIGAFLLLMISWQDALIFLVAFLVLQQVDNHLIYPHVVGNAVGLPAIWIFVAIIIGGNFGGIVGMVLAIPMFALFYTLLAQDLRKRELAAEEPAEE